MNSSTLFGIGMAIVSAAGVAMTIISAVKETRASKMMEEEPSDDLTSKAINFVKRYRDTIFFGVISVAAIVCTIAMFRNASEIAALSAAAVPVSKLAIEDYMKQKPKLIEMVSRKNITKDGVPSVSIDTKETNAVKSFKDDFGEIFESTPFEMLQHELDANKTLALSNTLSIYDLHKMYGIPDNMNPFNVNHGRGFNIEKMFDFFQYPWLGFDYQLMNDPDKGDVDYNINNGKPYYHIDYSVPVDNEILE